MTKKGNVEQLGEKVQNQAIKLSIEGLNSQSIADKLNEENNSNLSSLDIKTFLRRSQKRTAMIIKEDKNFQNKMIDTYFDTIKQLKDINSEIWKLFYEIKKDPEYISRSAECPKCHNKFSVQLKTYGSLLKTAEVLLNQIKHVDTILGKMQKKSLNVTYNYVDLSKKIGFVIPNMLLQLEKRGVLKVNKKRLKSYYGGIQIKKMDEEEENEEELEEEEELEAE